MFEDRCPAYCCFLSDAFGNAICPCTPGSISYVELSAPGNRAQTPRPLAGDGWACETQAAVLLKGYVTVAPRAGGCKETLPFSAIAVVRLPIAPRGDLTFSTKCFSCCIQPQKSFDNRRSACSEIVVQIEACACAEACEGCTDAIAPFENRNSCRACAVFQACTTLLPRRPAIQADAYQYNAIAQEQQRVFTDADELTEYGSSGIPLPADASLNKVYVNGFLQPPANYEMQRGRLRFKTEDLPVKGAVVSVYSARLKSARNPKYNTVTSYYVAIADGVKTTYTDADALTEYGDNGIPSPCEVSFFNLYVNGVLQPAPVYFLKKGVLELTEAPGAGQYILLESVVVQGSV